MIICWFSYKLKRNWTFKANCQTGPGTVSLEARVALNISTILIYIWVQLKHVGCKQINYSINVFCAVVRMISFGDLSLTLWNVNYVVGIRFRPGIRIKVTNRNTFPNVILDNILNIIMFLIENMCPSLSVYFRMSECM